MKPKVKDLAFERQLNKRIKRLYWKRGWKFTQRKKQFIKIMNVYWRMEGKANND